MNICFISYWSCPLTRIGVMSGGGMSVYLVNLANNLGELGHRVDIFTRAHKEKDEKVLEIHKRVRIIHLKQIKNNLYQDAVFFADKIIQFFNKEEIGYDLLHGHYFFSGLAGLALKKKLNLPLFSTFHSLAIPKEIYAGIKEPKRVIAEKKIIQQSDGIIVSTEIERKDLITLYKAQRNKIFIVPPGVNHHLFHYRDERVARKKLGLPLDKKLILFVGRIDPIKNISVLITALAILHDEYQGFKHNVLNILIGGDPRKRNFWQQKEAKKIDLLIKEKNIDCCVKFIGSKPVSELPFYYSAVDLVVLPSIYESFGLVILEAMASQKAVIASKVGGLKFLVKEKKNGRLFQSSNARQLSRIIWELINDKKERNRLGNNALIYSRGFSWGKQAKKIVSIYNKYL